MSTALPGGSELTSEEQQILDETDRFARRELYPLAPRMDRDEWWPDDLFRRLGAAGYLGNGPIAMFSSSMCGSIAMESAGGRCGPSAIGRRVHRREGERRLQLAEIGAGTTEIRKLIISDELLNEYLVRSVATQAPSRAPCRDANSTRETDS